MSFLFRILLRLSFVLLLVGISVPVFGSTTTFEPFISLRQEYRDNITFSETNEREDYITTVKGGLAFSKKTQRVNAKALFDVKKKFYHDHDELDDVDKSASVDYTTNVTERVSFGCSLDWSKDALRGAEAEDTGIALTGDREKYGASLKGSYMLSELSQLSTTVSANRTIYEEDPEEETIESISGNVEYSRDISKIWENAKALVNLTYQNYSSETDNSNTGSLLYPQSKREYSSDVWQLTFGISKQVTELFSYYAQVGAGYVDTSENYLHTGFLTATDTASDDSTSAVALAGVTYDGLYWDINLSVFHDHKGSSGTNGIAERTSASIDIEAHLFSDLWFTLESSCIRNKNERDTGDDLDKLTISAAPGLLYKIDDDFTLSAGYRFTSIDNRQDDTSKESNIFYINIHKNFNFDLD